MLQCQPSLDVTVRTRALLHWPLDGVRIPLCLFLLPTTTSPAPTQPLLHLRRLHWGCDEFVWWENCFSLRNLWDRKCLMASAIVELSLPLVLHWFTSPQLPNSLKTLLLLKFRRRKTMRTLVYGSFHISGNPLPGTKSHTTPVCIHDAWCMPSCS